MFTGIIEHVGQVIKKTTKNGCLWRITVPFGDDLKCGESININGACHTVTHFGKDFFEVFSSEETLTTTSLGQVNIGQFVNLERAMVIGSRLDGHLVYGHVDGTAKLLKIDKGIKSTLFTFLLSKNWIKYTISKGSISVDGISLTIYEKNSFSFQAMIIPHTLENTTFKNLKLGQEVNIELDVVGKYLENFYLEKNR